MKICHLTSVHPHYDTRIFFKECVSLARAGHEVHLIAPGAPDQVQDGVHLHGLQKTSKGRIFRVTETVWQVYQKACVIGADYYHFHDPELIPIGLLLKGHGEHVIYDIHENVPGQILTKYWIPRPFRASTAYAVKLLEAISARAFDGFITVTPTIAGRFPQHKTVIVQNFPVLSQMMVETPVPYQQRPLRISYIGAITRERGIGEMVQAMTYLPHDLDVQLLLAGVFAPTSLEAEMQKQPGWEKTRFLGWQSRDYIVSLLTEVRMGLVLFHPAPNHIDAQPNKLFEYMSAALPVIASDFPLWRRIIEGAGCGLLIDPLDPQAITNAIEYLLTHPSEAEAMGQRGREAVEKWYNWEPEAEKLMRFYDDLSARSNMRPST